MTKEGRRPKRKIEISDPKAYSNPGSFGIQAFVIYSSFVIRPSLFASFFSFFRRSHPEPHGGPIRLGDDGAMAFPATSPEPGFGGEQAKACQNSKGDQTDNAKRYQASCMLSCFRLNPAACKAASWGID